MIPQPQQEHNHLMPLLMAFGVGILLGGQMLLILIVSFSHDVEHALVAIGIMLVGLTMYLAPLPREVPE